MTSNHLCNLCGLSCGVPNPSFGKNQGDLGLIECVVSGGYDSTPGNGEGALDDTMAYQFSLCEFCLDWLFVQFKVPVEVSDYMNPDERKEKWVSAKDRVHKDDWRAMKTVFLNEFEKRNKVRELKNYE